ncbi:nucleotidyltransferase domain-containing protein [Microbacterium bovistercoris]|uniref:Nucleotidyltransferase domain-containing protein n=1 Tax=Microbacterium bovistercoris TaxID=2293570 RepID=A0A371NVX2_9MICO|nr:nucleotidyltransferase domain-containing protein [Microbacterium bovistercoris]REJ06640.1 nucleotidyltransferase domain-containing protein [Microbacterium bovistercoris]
MDFTAATERFVAAHFPGATTVIVGGSTARGERTASSDIDLLLIGEELFTGDQTSAASTHAFEDEVFEVFAYTAAGFAEWAQRGVDQHRPVIVHMLVEGCVVREGAELDELREHWADVLEAGPELTEVEAVFRRYVITDVLDDLRDAADPLERHVLASVLFERTAELMLLAEGQWLGTGKWLPRRLRVLETDRVEALSAPLLAGDYGTLANRVQAELDRAGGRMQDGFVR